MCGELKVNQKTIRISDSVYDYIMKFDGDNFNDKLNNVVMYFMRAEDDKNKQISDLDEQISFKKKEFDTLFSMFFNLQKLERTEQYFEQILLNYKDDLEKFTREYKEAFHD